MRNRIISFVVCAVLVFVMLPTFTSCEKQAETLNVFNWGQYIANGDDGTVDIIAKFEKESS